HSRLSPLLIRPPLSSTLFPYTTLFRSGAGPGQCHAHRPGGAWRAPAVRGTRGPSPAGPAGPWPEGAIQECVGAGAAGARGVTERSEEHTSELQSRENLVCRLLLEKKKH